MVLANRIARPVEVWVRVVPPKRAPADSANRMMNRNGIIMFGDRQGARHLLESISISSFLSCTILTIDIKG